jgi:polysaccharide biosynthesis transport protein
LAEVGPLRKTASARIWPTQADVEDLQDAIAIKAPNGAEFGKTEVFYLLVRDSDRTRALALAKALTNQLELYLQTVRQRTAASLVEELARGESLARAQLDAATDRLAGLEQTAGTDFAELRLLTDSVGGESNLRSTLTAVKNDLRQARLEQADRQQLFEFLRSVQHDPSLFLTTPSDLLASQPALEQLRRGLTEAELNTARLQGLMTPHHPLVQAAMISESEIRQRLKHEIAAAVLNLQTDLRLAEGRLATLEGQLAENSQRMSNLASLRARYANSVSEVRHHDEMLKHAQQDLAAARAGLAAANTTSLLTRLEDPYTLNRPHGPSRAVIVLAGIVGGFALGVGLVFHQLPAGPDAPRESRTVQANLPQAKGNPQPLPRQPERPTQPERRSSDRRSPGEGPCWRPSAQEGFSLPAILGFASKAARPQPASALSLKEALERLS